MQGIFEGSGYPSEPEIIESKNKLIFLLMNQKQDLNKIIGELAAEIDRLKLLVKVATDMFQAIKEHQEMIGGKLGQLGVTWHIANKALSLINQQQTGAKNE